MPRESTIQVYRSSTAANVPTGLTSGELAANLVDRKLFVGGTNGSTITFIDASAVVTGVNGTTGNVTNVAVTNATNNFTAVQAFPNGISGNSLSIAGGATFAGGTMDFTAASPTIQGYNPTGTLVLTTYGTNYTLNGSTNPRFSLASGDAGVFPASDFATLAAATINLNAGSSMNIGSNTTNVLTINGVASFPNNSVHFAQGLSANGMLVAGSRGATFTTRASFSVGLTTSSAWIGGQGATFNSNATFNNAVSVLGGLTSNSLWIGGQGATFNSNATFNNAASFVSGLTTQSISVAQGGTFASTVSILGSLTAQGLFVAQGATFNSTTTTTGFATFNAGITASSTWIGANGATFNSRMSAISGLTSANLWVGNGGATFNSPVTFGVTASCSSSMAFQNAEYIRNTTDGQMDFMPSPAASTAFGLYMDMTSWTYGVVLGTIRSSDNAKNTGGNLRFDVPLTINNDTFFQLGSDGQYRFQRTTVGNDTAQFGAYCDGVNNSGAFAFLGYGSEGAPNRSPTTLHANPNVYIYRNGSANAGDFMRMEHDGAVGRIASGATSGIELSPGRGTVSISGGISADSYVLSQNGIQTKTTAYSLTGSDSGKVIIFNTAAGVTANIPAGLPIGFSVTMIQIGAGQVTVTGPAGGITFNSYNGLVKTAGQHASASLISYQTNVFNLAGNLA